MGNWTPIATILILLESGATLGIGEAYSRAGQFFWRTIGASILQTVGVTIGLILLVLPGIYLAVRWIPIQFLILEENSGVFDAFTRSGELVKGRWWSTFGHALLIEIIVFAVFMALFFLIGFGSLGAGLTFEEAGGFGTGNMVVGLLFSLLVLPIELFLYTFFYELYRGLKATR